ncbi:MAG: hypothetical protein SVM79_01980, partial [Chloroflexota bacterium]|nr:hypothetical protein [Chloroflexota bacterium]
MKRVVIIGLLLALVSVMVGACGGSDASGVLEQAIEAMNQHPGFRISLGTPGTESKPSLNIEFSLPDRMRYETYGPAVYQCMIAIGHDTFISRNGLRWEEHWGSVGAMYNLWNPYQLLKHAHEPVDEGKATLNGKKVRIIEAEVDISDLATDNTPEPMIEVSLRDHKGLRGGNDELVQSLGYEVLNKTNHETYLFKRDVFITMFHGEDKGHFCTTIRNATSVSPELEQEFKDILGCYGVGAAVWENARIKQLPVANFASEFTKNTKSKTIRVWIDEESLLP